VVGVGVVEAAVVVATTQIPAEIEAAIFTTIPEVGPRTASAAWAPTPLCVEVPTRAALAATAAATVVAATVAVAATAG